MLFPSSPDSATRIVYLQVERDHCDEDVVPRQEPEQFLLVKAVRLRMYGFADTVACIGNDPRHRCRNPCCASQENSLPLKP